VNPVARAPAPELIGDSMGRALYLSTISDLGEWPSTLLQPKPYFVLLLVLDASKFTDGQLRAFADKVATQGVGYVYAWGPDADRVHFIFDLALYVDNEDLRREADENDTTILTSSDENEDLDDAIYFAVFDAHPDDYYYAPEGWNPLLAIVVGSPDWADQVRRRFLDTEALSEDVLAREPPPPRFAGLRRWWLRRRVKTTLRRVRKRWDLDP
jgi:hypothetical protein